MWIKRKKSKDAFLKDYDRAMLRSAFVSLFWSIITYKRQHGGFALKVLADRIGVNKSAPTRWFSGDRPNWTVNTIADIASALDIDLVLRARDRKTGVMFAPHGVFEPQVKTSGDFVGSPVMTEGFTNSSSDALLLGQPGLWLDAAA